MTQLIVPLALTGGTTHELTLQLIGKTLNNIYEQLLNKAIVKANGRVIYPVGRKQAIRDGMIYQDFYERWELWFNIELDNGHQTTDVVF